MNTKVLSFVVLFMFGAMAIFAGTKTENVKVFGNCDMCKSRIEKAAKTVDDVSAFDWNKKTKMMEVTFDDSKTDVKKVETAIASVGHDTELVKATDASYDKLPSCCHYDRAGLDMKVDGKVDMKMEMSPKK